MFKANDRPQVEDGVYSATLLAVELVTPGDDAQFKDPYARWKFVINDDDEYDNVELIANSSLNFGPKAKARKWVQAILGRQIENGEEIDPPDICPRDCRIVVRLDHESGFSRIEDVLGEAKKKGQKQKATASDDDGVEL